MGGLCVSQRCVCDAAFTGPTCSRLNLVPAPTASLWDRGNATASWGGNVVYDAGDQQWHLFFAELLNHCPLGTWGTNSVVSHATAASPTGPFVKQETLLPAFRHNPSVAYDASTKTFLLFSIGNGTSSGGPPPEHCAPDTLARSDDELGPPHRVHPAGAGVITMLHAKSANGPWTSTGRNLAAEIGSARAAAWDFFVTNPSVHVFENGSILMAYRAGNTSGSVENHGRPGRVGVAFAPSWRQPFERKSEQPIFPDVMEDPGIFRDERGNFHIVSHYWKNGPGGHGVSKDGLSWTFVGQAYGYDIAWANGSTSTLAGRERPQVVSLGGKPALLFTGVRPEHGLSYTQVQPINQAVRSDDSYAFKTDDGGGTVTPARADTAATAAGERRRCLIRPGSLPLDTDGNVVHAHGAGVYVEGDSLFLLGTSEKQAVPARHFNAHSPQGRTRSTRAGIEWRRCHRAVCAARPR